MSAKPESTFTTSIHRHLPDKLYREKMHNPYRGGTPDVWYSGDKNDLWVEYKFLPVLRKTYKADLSALQSKWLLNRYNEGRNVAVIVGFKGGGFILRCPADWDTVQQSDAQPPFSREEIARWISNECLQIPR